VYINALLNKFKFTLYSDRTPEWKAQYPNLAVYRPFPAPEYFLETTHDEVREGQFFYIRFRTLRVPAGRKFKYQVSGVDRRDIDLPLEGAFITAGNDAVAGQTIRINTLRDKRDDDDKTMIVAVDVPYDNVYGGGIRLELPIVIRDRSVYSSTMLPGIEASPAPLPAIDLRSPNGRYRAVYQEDGNFVISDTFNGQVIRAIGAGSRRLANQLDGNLVWYGNGTAVIDNTATAGNGPTYLRMFDDGILRLVRMLDDVTLWSSDVNLNRFDGVMVGGPNNSDLRRFQQAVLGGNQTLSRTIYNDMLPQTRAALNRNTAANSLAFVDPLLAYNNIAWNNMQVALNSYLNGEYSLIRNVRYTTAFKAYTERWNDLANESTELNLPDIPGKPGGFAVDGLGGSGIRPVGNTSPVSDRPAGTGPGGPPTGPGTGPGNQLPPGFSTPPPPPPVVPIAPTINLVSTNTSTNIRAVNITQSQPLAEIRIILNGTTPPNALYTRGNLINVPPGSILRATATLGTSVSTITTYTNTLGNPANNPNPPTATQAPTITLISTNATAKTQTVRLTSSLPNAQLRIVQSTNPSAIPNVNATNNATFVLTPNQTLRATATVNNVVSAITSYRNPLPPNAGSGNNA
jgi:hypothetical protein